MSPADMELRPWLHLDRGAMNQEEWEWTRPEWSGTL